MKLSHFFLASSIIFSVPQVINAAETVWQDSSLSADVRAKSLLHAMTQKEKLQLVVSHYAAGSGPKYVPVPKGAIGSAGYVPGIPRLGIPAQQISDAGLGVGNPNHIRPNDGATSLPSGQAISGTFNFDLAGKAGAMIGKEAYHRGFNVLLAGSTVLVRDPRNGRNFEYMGEDPLLAGYLAAAMIQGIQKQHVISTVKQYAFNTVETNRMKIDMKIDDKPARESDLLAFEIAVKLGQPGSIMCAYNKVNSVYSCENNYLLNLPKKSWGYRGYVMSDWGAVHGAASYANAGLDQESGGEFDTQIYFGKPLEKAIQKREVSQARLDDMVYRILYSMIQIGLYDHPAYPSAASEDIAGHEAVSQKVAEQGSVLLQNKRNILPLSGNIQKIALIGGHADKGVISGGGSAQVTPRGGNAVPNVGPAAWPGPIVYHPSSPMKELQALMPKTKIVFSDGKNIQDAIDLAKNSDIVIIFATKWSAESFDQHDLLLPGTQNQLIEQVAKQSGKPVIVVLETGNPIEMPWLNNVDAVLEAWYPGTSGGKAIANLLTGAVNPSGRVTTTWPVALSQVPYPYLEGAGRIVNSTPGVATEYSDRNQVAASMDLNEDGANVGYRWYEKKKLQPLYPFGYGLSYTRFKYKDFDINKDFNGKKHTITADVTVKNKGKVAGTDVIQIYGKIPDGSFSRLLGFKRVKLQPGETQTVTVPLFPMTLAHYNPAKHDWEIIAGDYDLMVSPHALSHEGLHKTVHLDATELAD